MQNDLLFCNNNTCVNNKSYDSEEMMDMATMTFDLCRRFV